MITVVDAIISRLQALDLAMFVIWALTWTMFAFAAGGIAQGKGHTGGGYFLLGLVLSPVVGMLVAFILKDERKATIDSLTARLDALQSPGGKAASTVQAAASPAPPAPTYPSPDTARANLASVVAFAFITVLIGVVAWVIYARPGGY